jgi:hypothetical protein
LLEQLPLDRPPLNRRSLGRALAAALLLKLVLLTLLYLLFFDVDARPRIDAEVAARHLFVSVSLAATPEDAQ